MYVDVGSTRKFHIWRGGSDCCILSVLVVRLRKAGFQLVVKVARHKVARNLHMGTGEGEAEAVSDGKTPSSSKRMMGTER